MMTPEQQTADLILDAAHEMADLAFRKTLPAERANRDPLEVLSELVSYYHRPGMIEDFHSLLRTAEELLAKAPLR